MMTLNAQPSPIPTEQPLLKLCTGQQHGGPQQGRGVFVSRAGCDVTRDHLCLHLVQTTSSMGAHDTEGPNGRSGKKRFSGAGWNRSMRREDDYRWTSGTHVVGDIHGASGKNMRRCSDGLVVRMAPM